MGDNRRVDALLRCAERHGLQVTASEHVENCWTVRGNNSHSVTIYGGPNHSASVMGDLPGQRDWIEISQRRAMAVMAGETLWLQDMPRTTTGEDHHVRDRPGDHVD